MCTKPDCAGWCHKSGLNPMRSVFFSYVAIPCVFLAIVGTVNPVSLLAADADDYLKAIEMETEKVERKTIDADTEASSLSTGNAAAPAGEGFSTGLSMDGFGQELADKYTGTARFYEKLPRRTQEEVYQEYLQGASISEVRAKIMNRYLHR